MELNAVGQDAAPVPQDPVGDARAFRAPALLRLLFAPLSTLWQLLRGAVFFFATLFPFLPRLTGMYPSNRYASRTGRAFSGEDNADRFVRKFTEDYGDTALPFFRGGYSQALALAKREARYLLVVVQSDQHDDTFHFNRHTLTDSDVVQFILEHDAVLWAGSVHESEAFQVANALGCTRFPFVALIAPTSTTMSMIARVEGMTSPADVVSSFRAAMSRHSSAVNRVRAERREQNAAREIRAQQDRAYEASLSRDRERLRGEQERQEREEQAVRDAERVHTERERWRRRRAASIQPEPKEGARIQIRFADGERIVRRFAKERPVEEIYAYIECRGESAPEAGGEADAAPLAETFEFPFQLVSPMPRTVIPCSRATIESTRLLYPSGSVLVESNE